MQALEQYFLFTKSSEDLCFYGFYENSFQYRFEPETHLLVAAQIFPTAQIFLELKFILGIQDEP